MKSIPVNVPAATVLRSSSAPLAFSNTTPKALYNKAATVERDSLKICCKKINYCRPIHAAVQMLSSRSTDLPTEPNVLAQDAPCLVTMLIILKNENKKMTYDILYISRNNKSNFDCTHCTLRGLDQAMSLVSLMPILRPLKAPNVAPVAQTNRISW